jgi:hypothetical protein
MKRKQQFLKAVQILAPGDALILNAAQRVPEERVPLAPGGAAIEFVAALHKLIPWPSLESSCPGRGDPNVREHSERASGLLSMEDTLRVRSARCWLELGEPDEALRELEALPSRAWNHPSAVKVRLAALRALGPRKEMTVQE